MSTNAFRPWQACLLALSLVIAPAAAQQGGAVFPDRPIRLVVPFPPGGGTDILARALSGSIGKDLGQPVVVENRPGASTSLAAEAVAKSPADGHTLLVGTRSTYVTNGLLYRRIPYDPLKDLQSVALISRMDMLLVANNAVKADTARELVELIKANPGKMTYASPGIGTPHHLGMELFRDVAGLDLTHVPYKGAAPTLQDLLGERIDVMFLDYATARALVEAKRIKVFAVASGQRVKGLPDVPTLTEAGYPGVEALPGWFGISAPAGLPTATRAALEKAVSKAMNDATVLEQLVTAGYTPAYAGGDEMTRLIVSEQAKWGEIIRSKNISAE